MKHKLIFKVNIMGYDIAISIIFNLFYGSDKKNWFSFCSILNVVQLK